MVVRSVLPTAALMVLWSGTALARSPTCSPARASAAEAAADALTSWRQVSEYYQQYRACDEGGMAEASSEGIARLLADHWTTLPALSVEARKIPGLRSFVAAHINSTLDTGDVEKIARSARTSCPGGEARLCGDIQRAAAGALK